MKPQCLQTFGLIGRAQLGQYKIFVGTGFPQLIQTAKPNGEIVVIPGLTVYVIVGNDDGTGVGFGGGVRVGLTGSGIGGGGALGGTAAGITVGGRVTIGRGDRGAGGSPLLQSGHSVRCAE